MIDTALLASIAQQMMNGNTVDVNGKLVPVSRPSKHRLRTLAFIDGRAGVSRPLNKMPEKPSRWGAIGARGASGCPVQGCREPTDSWQWRLMGKCRLMEVGTENNRGGSAQSLATALFKFLQRCRFLKALVALHGVEFAGDILD